MRTPISKFTSGFKHPMPKNARITQLENALRILHDHHTQLRPMSYLGTDEQAIVTDALNGVNADQVAYSSETWALAEFLFEQQFKGTWQEKNGWSETNQRHFLERASKVQRFIGDQKNSGDFEKLKDWFV